MEVTDELLSVIRRVKVAYVEKFAASVGDLPRQGSAEWKILRQHGFGGSEIASILGLNTFSDLKKTVAGKVGLLSFDGSMATRWGNLFENITEMLMHELLPVAKMWEMSSLPGFCPGHRYSPDGVAVIKFICNGRPEYLITLMEYKAPFSSIPIGAIPKHYAPQVKIGLCDLPFVETALFVNNVYRKCSLSMFEFNSKYDREVHTKPFDADHLPIAAGVICFTQSESQKEKMAIKYGDTEGSDSDDSSYEFEERLHTKIYNGRSIDVGGLSNRDFGMFLKLYMEKMVTAEFLPPLIFEEELDRIPFMACQRPIPARTPQDADRNTAAMRQLKKAAQTPVKAGAASQKTRKRMVLPWKMFMSDMIIQERDDSFVDVARPAIENGMRILRDILDGDPSHETIRERFYTHFENKNHYVDRQIEQSAPPDEPVMCAMMRR